MSHCRISSDWEISASFRAAISIAWKLVREFGDNCYCLCKIPSKVWYLPSRYAEHNCFKKGEGKKKKLAPFMSHCGKKTAALQTFNWKLPVSSANMSWTTCKIPWDGAIIVRYRVQAFSKLQKCRFHSQSGKPEWADGTSHRRNDLQKLLGADLVTLFSHEQRLTSTSIKMLVTVAWETELLLWPVKVWQEASTSSCMPFLGSASDSYLLHQDIFTSDEENWWGSI